LIALFIRFRAAGETESGEFTARETVARETLALFATSSSVTFSFTEKSYQRVSLWGILTLRFNS